MSKENSKDKLIKILCLRNYNNEKFPYFDKTYGRFVSKNGNEIGETEFHNLYYTTEFNKKFIQRESVTYENFMNEIKTQKFMHKNHIAAKIYKYGIFTSDKLLFGYFIMKKMLFNYYVVLQSLDENQM